MVLNRQPGKLEPNKNNQPLSVFALAVSFILQLLIIRLPPPLPRYASLVIFRRRPPRRYGHFGRFDRDGILTAATGGRRQGRDRPGPAAASTKTDGAPPSHWRRRPGLRDDID